MQQPKSPNHDLLARLEELKIQALIFDLDGVVTPTAEIHARAWKKMFDEYLVEKGSQQGKNYELLNIATDYPEYLDGMSRYDGIRNFLKSREISLPEGSPDDGPETESIVGLGNRKNLNFRQVLEKEGIQPFPDTVNFIKTQKAAGRRIALISASKNCRDILKAANAEYLFEIVVDGLLAEELKLKSKPAPDVFLEAARRLDILPSHSAIFEDSRAGVKAGKVGNFALVIGVDRSTSGEDNLLFQNGADLVIPEF